jgi:hypothetical protein
MPNRPTSFEKDKKIFDRWRSFLKKSGAPDLVVKNKKPKGNVILQEASLDVRATGGAQLGLPAEPDLSATAGPYALSGRTAPGELGDWVRSMKDLEAEEKAAAAGTDIKATAQPAIETTVDIEGPNWEKTIVDLGGISTGREGVTSEPKPGKPGFINTVYRDQQGNPFLANTKDFKVDGTGAAPLPNPGTNAVSAAGNPIQIWHRSRKTGVLSLTKSGRGILKNWLENNPGYKNMLAKARVHQQPASVPWSEASGYSDRPPPGTPDPISARTLRSGVPGQMQEERLNQKEIVQEVYNRLIKMIKKGNEK